MKSEGGSNYYINKNLEIIEQDDEGYGYIAGKLKISKTKKYNILYNKQKYIIEKY